MREPVPPRPMTGPPDPMAQPSHGTSPWNLPNALTVLRILLVPVFGSMLLAQNGADAGQRFAALAVFVVAMITDRIDGDIARSRGLVTDVGKILDPIADKALLGMAFPAIPWPCCAKARAARYWCSSPNWRRPAWVLPAPQIWQWTAYSVLAIAVALTVVTGLDYLVQAHRLRRTSPRAMAKRAAREAKKR